MPILPRVKNALLAFFASVTYLVFRRRAPRAPSRVLVIQGSKMGDMVCTTPLFRAIKGAYPESELVVMGNPINGELLRGNPHITEYLFRPSKLITLTRLLAEKRPDIAFLPGPDAGALLALLFARVPTIVVPRIENGFSPYATRVYRLLSRLVLTSAHSMGSYAPREYLRLLEPLGFSIDDTRKELVVTEEARASVRMLLQDAGLLSGEKLLGIAPSAGNRVKLWGGERFAEVARTLAERHGFRVLIIGSPDDDEEARLMRSALPAQFPLVDFTGKLSMEELKALIAQLSLFISVDTGPIYIAEAFGIPTVDIVGPMDENEQPPRGERHRVVVPQREKPMLHIMNAAAFDWEEARRQAESITPEMVLREAEALVRL